MPPLTQTSLAWPDWIGRQTLSDWLTAREMADCQSAPSARRRADRLAGRLAAKRLLRDSLAVSPLSCEIASDGLAPVVIFERHDFPPLNLSISHSGGMGAASWADGKREGTVGIDAQEIRATHSGLRARALSAEEAAQDGDILLFWALKEAALKARRQPWGRSLRELVVTLEKTENESGEATIWDGAQKLKATWRRVETVWLARAVSLPHPQTFALSALDARTT